MPVLSSSTVHIYRIAALLTCLAGFMPTVQADGFDMHKLAHAAVPDIEIRGHLDASTDRDSASDGTITAERLAQQPLLRPADVLENVPGMVVTQHSGDGKANQYFLRGVNLDHGTDFATTVNGVPVNLPTHAHGQGYSDLNFLMPELVQRVDYRKGPYAAQDGDFSSAGAANFVYRTHIDHPFSTVTVGQRGYVRGMAAGTTPVAEDLVLLTAVERTNNNGPWTVPEGLRKTNALLTLSGGSAAQGWSSSLSLYNAHWTSTDQIAQRLIDQGSYQGQAFGRFDSLDPSDGGSTQRSSLSGEWHQHNADSARKFSWYVMHDDLDLYSNFTYNTQPTGDQFAQRDKRTVLGGNASQSWTVGHAEATPSINTVGLQVRQDQMDVGLDQTTQRNITSQVRADAVTQSLVGVYAENNTAWTHSLRTVTGVRVDQFNASVRNTLAPSPNAPATATQQSQQVSPKFSTILGPWAGTEIFFNAGRGFHSNDARSQTGLTRSQGEEVGLRTQALPHLQSSLALWRLDFDSELHYLGDSGTTEAGRPSRRTGLELTNRWTPTRQWAIDANLAWSRPRYTDVNALGNAVPNAVQKVAQLNALASDFGPWSFAMGLRYIGPAALAEDNSKRSSANTSVHMRVSKQINAAVDASLDVFNLTNRQNNDIQYAYTSRLLGEPSAGVNDYHVHPAEPRTLRLSARVKY
jgi:outer membrane receptor for Fe3+-dicitrate